MLAYYFYQGDGERKKGLRSIPVLLVLPFPLVSLDLQVPDAREAVPQQR